MATRRAHAPASVLVGVVRPLRIKLPTGRKMNKSSGQRRRTKVWYNCGDSALRILYKRRLAVGRACTMAGAHACAVGGTDPLAMGGGLASMWSEGQCVRARLRHGKLRR